MKKDKFYRIKAEEIKDGEVYCNSVYQVVKRRQESNTDFPALIWLSIKRKDKAPIRDWRDFQDIKNELVGKYYEGVELYPAESRKVDMANQYHLWIIDDIKFRFPFGFNDRIVISNVGDYADGAKQRTSKQTLADLLVGWFRLNRLLKKEKSNVRND